MGNTGLPIACFDARAESCPLDSKWRKRVQVLSPLRKDGTKKVYTKLMGWHIYAWNGIKWAHYEKCGCYKKA